jgi:uncharacterized membrane protein
MGRFVSVVLAGFVLGAPAVPVGLSFELAPWVVLLAVLLGAFGSLVITVFATERVRRLVRARWVVRPSRVPTRGRASTWARRSAQAVINRFGAMGFGLVGPALFGTWGAALLGSAIGLARRPLLAWLTMGATLWCSVLLVASDAVVGFLAASNGS